MAIGAPQRVGTSAAGAEDGGRETSDELPEEEEENQNSMMAWMRNGIQDAVKEYVPGGGTELPLLGLFNRITNPYGGAVDEIVRLPEFARQVERNLSDADVPDKTLYDYNRACYEVSEHYGTRDTGDKHILFCAWVATISVAPRPAPPKKVPKSSISTPTSIVNKLRISLDIELESERALYVAEEEKKRRKRWEKKEERRLRERGATTAARSSMGGAMEFQSEITLPQLYQKRAELAAELLCVRFIGYKNMLLLEDARSVAIIAATIIDTRMQFVDVDAVEARAVVVMKRCNADKTLRATSKEMTS